MSERDDWPQQGRHGWPVLVGQRHFRPGAPYGVEVLDELRATVIQFRGRPRSASRWTNRELTLLGWLLDQIEGTSWEPTDELTEGDIIEDSKRLAEERDEQWRQALATGRHWCMGSWHGNDECRYR